MEQADLIYHDSKPIHIIIAEDHQMVRDMFVSNINSLRHCKVVFAAADGQELLEYLKTADEKPDLCLLDINMPQLNGYDTQAYITQHWPGLKTLAISIYDEPQCVFQMLKNGSNGFISKSCSLELLREAILCVCEHGSYPIEESGEENALSQSKGLPTLTIREKECLNLFCEELNVEEIAKRMYVSIRTVERHRESVYRKLKVTNMAELIFYVNKTGIAFMK